MPSFSPVILNSNNINTNNNPYSPTTMITTRMSANMNDAEALAKPFCVRHLWRHLRLTQNSLGTESQWVWDMIDCSPTNEQCYAIQQRYRNIYPAILFSSAAASISLRFCCRGCMILWRVTMMYHRFTINTTHLIIKRVKTTINYWY